MNWLEKKLLRFLRWVNRRRGRETPLQLPLMTHDDIAEAMQAHLPLSGMDTQFWAWLAVDHTGVVYAYDTEPICREAWWNNPDGEMLRLGMLPDDVMARLDWQCSCIRSQDYWGLPEPEIDAPKVKQPLPMPHLPPIGGKDFWI